MKHHVRLSLEFWEVFRDLSGSWLKSIRGSCWGWPAIGCPNRSENGSIQKTWCSPSTGVFFRRLRDGQFAMNESGAVWHLLAAITYRKVQQAARFHHRHRRDVRREMPLERSLNSSAQPKDFQQMEPGPEDLAVLYETLEHFVRRVSPTRWITLTVVASCIATSNRPTS